ncbi:MAG: replication initiation protein [Clostridia bacterium]
MSEIKKEEQKILMKNNQLISKTRYNITTIENRIFQTILYKLQRSSQDTYSCTITHDEFKGFIKNNNQATIKSITATLTNLRKQSIYIKKQKKNGEIIWGQFGFINGFLYDEELNTFIIKASDEVYSMLRDYLGSGYTPVNLFLYLKLNNSYAQRLYELLRLWTYSKKVITYSVKELKELMMIEDKYPLYADFKKRVIKTAVKELNATEIFKIEIKENKIGRKVDSIDFMVEDLDKRKYFEKDIVQIDESKFNVVDCDDEIEQIVIQISNDFYIPNKKLFTKKTLELFEVDFNEYDFNESKIKNLFYESIGTTLEKDDIEKIYIKSYNYFKKVLSSKLETVTLSNKKEKIKKTKFHNFDETYTNYSEDELDDLILRSQQKKFG